MPQTTYIEKRHPGEFLLSEANGDRSRESVILAPGESVAAGAPLGKILLGGAAGAATAGGGNTGNGTVGSITANSAAKIGTYTLTCITAAANGGVFSVTDPDGVALSNATVAEAYSDGGLGFTIADGANDFVVGDTFTITVTPAVAAAVAGNTGNGTIGTVTVAATGVKPGVYRATCIEPAENGGKFLVEDPDGVAIGVASVGSAFSGGGLGFTIADGANDFVSGDAFTITVSEGSGQYRALNPSAKDGTQIAAGLAYGPVDASEEAKRAVAIVRDAEYNAAIIPWGDLTENQIATATKQLAALGIIARNGIGQELARS